MAKMGLGKWLLSWVSKPFAALARPFESLLSIVRSIAPKIGLSTVAEAFRAAEKVIAIEPLVEAMKPDERWPIEYMIEEELNKPRRYLVTFEVLVSYPAEGITQLEERDVYFMQHLSKSEYERQYLEQYMDEGSDSTGIIKGARAVELKHNKDWHYDS